MVSELLVASDDEDEGGVGDDDEHRQDVHQEVPPVPVVLVNTLRLKTQSGVGEIHVSDLCVSVYETALVITLSPSVLLSNDGSFFIEQQRYILKWKAVQL